MGLNYYKILGVDRNATDDELKEAYGKLSLKWHQYNHPNNEEEAQAKLREISKAYKVLSDPQKRAAYDKGDQEGLKDQSPRGSPRNPEDIFGEYFGFSSSPYGSGGRTKGSGSSNVVYGEADDLFASFGGFKVNGGGIRKAPPIENRLPCTLEELYKGTTKKMKISREIVDINGNCIKVEEILTVEVKPGWKKGTKITFPEKGNVQQNVVPADIIFIIDEKPHGVFTREGDDLVVTQKVSLGEALKGYTVRLTTLDGRSLNIAINNVIHPKYQETVAREGMPIQNQPSKRGNLTIKFNVRFPTTLTEEQKAGIKF